MPTLPSPRPAEPTIRGPGRMTVLVSWAGLVLAAVPPQGTGVSLCWVHAGTDVPCPGCGMTRSLGHAVRGGWEESWHCHPFGLPILGFFACVAVLSLLPVPWREVLARADKAHPGRVRAAKIAFLSVFVGFGLGRALLQVSGWGDFGI